MAEEGSKKSELAKREEEILRFWQENKIFEKSLQKDAPQGEYIFYEGPPTANGRPGIHHLEARAFKDAIPRYRTMRGYRVARKGGWDTHGLPVELQVEKELGLKSKKEVEAYGVDAFNQKCKDSVWTYVHEWENFTNRMGYWIDLQNPYITYQPDYIESLWHIVKSVDERGLLYKDYKVLPWCPRCGTALSSHELAQGYQDTKDLAVTVKFKLTDSLKNVSSDSVHLLAWTTTPWTLPGNVGLAVNEQVLYVAAQVDGETLILAKDRLEVLAGKEYKIIAELAGRELVGLGYEPLYPFLKEAIAGPEKEKLGNAYKVYAADFVTTLDGTGIVHTAVMYGQDDFELGSRVGLPKHHLVNDDGTFKSETGFLAGKFVKDPETDVAIIKDLAGRSLLFAKAKYEHSYPFCWRCHTPLIYFARDSWYIKMSSLRDELVKENQQIKWEPERIRDGRFGEWLREVKDWAISRERYWGTPLPVWVCETCQQRRVVGSIKELAAARQPRNQYIVMRHGEALSNVRGVLSAVDNEENHLTNNGQSQVKATAEQLKPKKIDLIITSPILRAQETAVAVADALGLAAEQIVIDERLREVGFGDFEDQSVAEYHAHFASVDERFSRPAPNGENLQQVKARAVQSLYEIDNRYQGKNILLVTHEAVAWLLFAGAQGLSNKQTIGLKDGKEYFLATAEARPLEFVPLPHNQNYELDLHRPYIDEVVLPCDCGGQMRRVKEVMDVWFDSGAMPFAQAHYPFAVDDQELRYPADFISEAIDQTRGWFYTLHAVGVLLGKGRAYNNVICLGHILDAEGKKMSKSLGNVVNPWEMMDKYGADALRFWMYSVNQPGDAKNFDERTVDEVVKKVFNLTANVVSFYQLYADSGVAAAADSDHVLDRWIVSRLHALNDFATKNLDAYVLLEPTRAIREFIGDLSQWYIRRSRDRFKSDDLADRQAAVATTRYVLVNLAKLMAPFTPFLAEQIFQAVKSDVDPESVHLAEWPEAGKVDQVLIEHMTQVRELVSRGLELRAKAGIKVRQPLAVFSIDQELPDEYLELIKDEVNVEAVVFKPNAFDLDTTITPELKEKGELRDLIREIQDWRKEQNLKPGELAVVPVAAAKRELALKFAAELKSATAASDFKFE